MRRDHQKAPVRQEAGQALSVDRVVAFSDGVMAIAGTLLAFNIKAPVELNVSFWVLLGQIWPQVQSYFISFVVVGVYWNNHHRLFRLLARVDGQLIALNLLFLALICLLPFATSLIGTDRPTTATVTFYALTVGLIGYAHSAIWFKALHAPVLLIQPKPDFDDRSRSYTSLLTPTYFLLSIFIAQTDPALATLSWLGLGVILPAARRLTKRINLSKS